MRITVVSSGLTTTHAFTSVSPAATAAAAAGAIPNGTLRPSASPPPATAAEPTLNLRRERFGALPEALFPMVCPLYELQVLDRQAADRFPRRCEDRVHDGRRNDADRRLADAAPEVESRGEHALDFRHVLDLQDAIVVEVGFHDAAFVDRDLVVEHRGETHGDCTVGLRGDLVRIHVVTAVRGDHEPMHLELAFGAHR